MAPNFPPAPRISEALWSVHREEIRRLYVDERKSLEETMETIATHGFIATKQQYVRKLRNWGFRKSISSEEWSHSANLLRRRMIEGKDTEIVVHGKLLDRKRLKKGLGRLSTQRHRNASDQIQCSSAVVAFTPPATTVADINPPPSPRVTHSSTTGTDHAPSTDPASPSINASFCTIASDALQTGGCSPSIARLSLSTDDSYPSSPPDPNSPNRQSAVEAPYTTRLCDLQSFLLASSDHPSTSSPNPLLPLLAWASYEASRSSLYDKLIDTIVTWICEKGHERWLYDYIEKNLPSTETLKSHMLLSACRLAKIDLVKWLLDSGTSLEFFYHRDDNGPMTPVKIAAMHGNIHAVAILLERGADPSPALYHLEQQLFAQVYGLDNATWSVQDFLMNASKSPVVDVVSRLTQVGMQVKTKAIEHLACYITKDHWRQFPRILGLLVDLGMPDKTRQQDPKAVQYAILPDAGETSINHMIDSGANINRPIFVSSSCRFGRLISIAADRGNAAMVNKLLSSGADPNGVTLKHELDYFIKHTPTIPWVVAPALIVASHRDDVVLVDQLLRSGAKATIQDDTFKSTALHKAASVGVARMLLDHGADPNAFDLLGKTPLHYVVAKGYVDLARYLVQRGAVVDQSCQALGDGFESLPAAPMQ